MSFKQKDLADFDMADLDELIAKLTPEEIEQFNNEIDPDDPYLPPSDRCKEQTKKLPTGPYSREHLIKFLEDQGKNEKDWEQNKPYVKEKRGKVWQPPPKPEPSDSTDPFDSVSTEWDEILAGASEAEIVELAAILGFTGLVNQVQFHAAQKSESTTDETASSVASVSLGGWNAAAKAEALKFVAPEPDNQTDVDESVKKLEANDADLVTLNLNNIKNISIEKLNQVIEAVKKNTTLKILTMSNVDMPDSVAKNLVGMLEENKTLLTLNIESNLLTGAVVGDICRATLKNQSLLDLRLSNQRAQILGNKVEQDIADSVAQNKTLLRLGVHLQTLGPRAKVQETLKRNWDRLRLKRVNKEEN